MDPLKLGRLLFLSPLQPFEGRVSHAVNIKLFNNDRRITLGYRFHCPDIMIFMTLVVT